MTPDIIEKITFFLALIISLTVHEFAHSAVAKWQGDDTSYDLGRMTLNPLVHLDLVGSVIFPLVAAFTGMPLFGWAKPVPVNPSNFRNKKWGDAMVSFAGPLSNLILCAISLIFITIHQEFLSNLITSNTFFHPLLKLLNGLVIINAILAFFNLIPLPPLDGGAVIGGFLPKKWAEKYHQLVAPYGFMILIMIMFSSGFTWIYKIAMGYIYISQLVLSSLFSLLTLS